MTTEIEIRRVGDDLILKHGTITRIGAPYGILVLLGALLGKGINGLNDGEALIFNFKK